jgi:hypothetical protein
MSDQFDLVGRSHALLEQLAAESGLTAHTASSNFARFNCLGYAWEVNEGEPGLACVAVPIFGPDHILLAAVSVVGTTHQISEERIPTLGVQVKHFADATSARLVTRSQRSRWRRTFERGTMEPVSLPVAYSCVPHKTVMSSVLSSTNVPPRIMERVSRSCSTTAANHQAEKGNHIVRQACLGCVQTGQYRQKSHHRETVLKDGEQGYAEPSFSSIGGDLMKGAGLGVERNRYQKSDYEIVAI